MPFASNIRLECKGQVELLRKDKSATKEHLLYHVIFMTKFFLYFATALYLIVNTIKKIIIKRIFIPVITNATFKNREFIIPRGPFKGMKYNIREAHGSTWLPKLFGIYESELHPTLNEIISDRLPTYDVIIDVGTADGYYLTGFALKSKNLNKSIDLIGFELDEKRRNECKRLSQLNGVNDVKLLKKGTPQNLASVVKKYKKGLIFCDCEGCEFTLFSKSMIKNLTNFDLLIEIHDIEEGESAFNIFIKKLSKHFDIDIIGANKILNMNKIEDVKIPKFILREIFTEGRIKSVGWIYAKSKSN
jgi:hypothetical protein